MIKDTLKNTKEATFLVHIEYGNMLIFGTGFFISDNGYFITANHVVEQLNIDNVVDFLERPDEFPNVMVRGAKVINKWPKFDLALLKAEFEENKQREYFKTRSDFPYLEIDYLDQEEGSPVYAFGYPLPKPDFNEIPIQDKGSIILGTLEVSPRVTSAIISSKIDYCGKKWTPSDPKYYVIDKALNYGNSGGPIIMSETGKAISVCVRFQPQEMEDSGIKVPSLYGITSSLQNIQNELKKLLKNN
jgi:serine protease Do